MSETELIDPGEEHIGSMKKPSEVIVSRNQLPRNELGKLSRQLVREMCQPDTLTVGRVVKGA